MLANADSDSDSDFFTDPGADALAHAQGQLQDEGKKTVIVLACANNCNSVSELTPLLQSFDIIVLSAVLPSGIHGNTLHQSDTLLISYEQEINADVHHNISKSAFDQDFAEESIGNGKRDQVVLADALCGGMESFIDALYRYLGTGFGVIGGGAGLMGFILMPRIWCNQGLLVDTAIVAGLPTELSTGIGHGWKIMASPHLISEPCDQDIQSINNPPVCGLCRQEILKLSAQEQSADNLFALAKIYPFCISELSGELHAPEGNTLVGAFTPREKANRDGGSNQLMDKSMVSGALR